MDVEEAFEPVSHVVFSMCLASFLYVVCQVVVERDGMPILMLLENLQGLCIQPCLDLVESRIYDAPEDAITGCLVSGVRKGENNDASSVNKQPLSIACDDAMPWLALLLEEVANDPWIESARKLTAACLLHEDADAVQALLASNSERGCLGRFRWRLFDDLFEMALLAHFLRELELSVLGNGTKSFGVSFTGRWITKKRPIINAFD